MPTFGWSTSTTNMSTTVHNAIQKAVVDTLRAGLVALPKGAVTPGILGPMRGENFTLVNTAYPDLLSSAVTTPLTEGVPPTGTALAVSPQTWTAQQLGLVAYVTDVAAFQSPHALLSIAPEKVARVVAQKIDDLAIAALAANGINKEYTGAILGTNALLDAKNELQARNVKPIAGVGYYAICHPYALRGLEGEANLNGYIDVQAQADAGKLSAGVVSQYRGISFLPSAQLTGSLSDTARTGPTGDFATDVWTLNAHGLNNGVRIQFSTLTGGTGYATATDYFVRDVTTNTFKLSATKGGAVLDLTGSNVTASTFKSEQFPVYILGQGSMLAGDLGTFEYFSVAGPDAANPLNQYASFGAKGIFGAAVASFTEVVGGSAVPRVIGLSVMSGETF